MPPIITPVAFASGPTTAAPARPRARLRAAVAVEREREQPGAVVQQHDALARGLQRERLVGGRARRGHARVRVLGGVVELAEPEAHLEHARERRAQRVLGDEPVAHGVLAEVVRPRAAVLVAARIDRRGDRARVGRRVVVAAVHAGDAVAVRHDAPAEAPPRAQRAVEQPARRAARHAVDRVVRAHHLLRAALLDAPPERGQERLREVVRVDARVKVLARRLDRVAGEVLAARGDLEVRSLAAAAGARRVAAGGRRAARPRPTRRRTRR